MSADWRFARQPFWLFSHAFAAVVVISFIALGFWQLDRLGERRAANELIEARTAEAQELVRWPESSDNGSDLDYQAVEATASFVEADLVRIANRSQFGLAGEYVVAVIELADGSPLAVNRGFASLGAEELASVPSGPVRLTGWLRSTVERGRFGAVDEGSGDLLPRFDTDGVAARLGRDLPPVWLQLATIDGAPPDRDVQPQPIPLPPLEDGPHLSYAAQWFIFAILGVAFYGLLLRRRASGHRSTVTTAA